MLDAAGPGHLESDERWDALSIRTDFSGQVADDLDIDGCRFTGATLLGVELIRCRITDTVFELCDLSAASLSGAVLTRVRFVDCRLSGADLSETRLHDVAFEQCRLPDANLRMITSKRVELVRCDLQGVDLYRGSLVGARLFDCNLAGVELTQSDLRGARLHGSHLEDIKGADALRGTTIDSTQLLPVGLQLLGAFDITVDDHREPANEGTDRPGEHGESAHGPVR